MIDIETSRDKGADHVTIPYRHGVRIEESVTVNQSPEALYLFWRDLDNLPPFLRALMSDAEVIHEEPDTLIGWRSFDDADVAHAGSVHFTPATSGRSTEVKVVLLYDGRDPGREVQEELRIIKQLLETGEIARAS